VLSALRAPRRPVTERVNWKVAIECRDCGAEFNVKKVDSSVQVLDNRTRFLLVAVPNECPKCHNLRTVEVTQADAGATFTESDVVVSCDEGPHRVIPFDEPEGDAS
jgi:hypothetical protein